MSGKSPAFGQQTEIFVSSDASGPNVVFDDENRNFTIRGDNHRAPDALADVVPMAALLPREPEACTDEYPLESFPINRRKARHRLLSHDRCFPALDRHPLRALPVPGSTAPITRLLQHFLERSHFRARREEAAHRFVHCVPCIIRRRSRACDIQRHRMGDVLLAFPPNLHRVVNVHRRDDFTRRGHDQVAFSK